LAGAAPSKAVTSAEAAAAGAPAGAAPSKAVTSAEASLPWLSRLLRGWRGAVVVYLVFAGAYLGASGGRLRTHSQYNQYVYLADGWLHGRLTLAGPPPNEN